MKYLNLLYIITTVQHIQLGLIFGTSISVVSWMVGIICNSLFSKTALYQKLSNLNFIESKTINRLIGINYFKWVVKHTVFKYFNQKISIRQGNANLNQLRNEMTLAEISHLIGFVMVAVFAVFFGFKVSVSYGISIMVPNIFLNLYPSLLQQENKRRIDRLNKII
jgi:Glycosyl-4,4'-diaponeurosporenoate acyltransferase